MHVRSLVASLLLLAVALVPCAPLIVAGRPGVGHDHGFHHAHAVSFRQGLAEGVLYPRWAAAMNGGLGAPTFLFHSPLPYYLAAAGAGITGDTNRGFLLAAAALSVFAAASLYRLVRRDAGRPGALVAAAAFSWMPYALLDLYHRFAWAEFTALMWLPFVLLAARRLLECPRPRHALALWLGLAALAASHLATAILCGPFLAAWIGYEALRRRQPRPFFHAAAVTLLAALLLGAFLLPVLLERQLVHLDSIAASRHGQYGRDFLWQDEVAAGFSPDSFKPTVALAAAAQLLALAGAGMALLLRRRMTGGAAFLLAAGLAHLYLCTALSEPVWRVLPALDLFRLPWRTLGVVGLIAAWLLGRAADRVLPPRGRPGPALLCVLVPLLALAGISARQIHDAYPPGTERRRPLRESVPTLDYLPREVPLGHLLELAPYDPGRRLVEARGEVALDWVQWTPHRRRARVTAGAEGATLVLPIFRYPGWTLHLDRSPVALARRNALDLIEFHVPPGRHALTVEHVPTAPRRIGLWITFAAAVLGAAFCLAVRGRPAPPPAPLFAGRRRLLVFGAGAALLVLPVLFPAPYRPPHVVVITAPGLRADHAGFNGYERPTTRNLDFLALFEGVRFRRAYTPVPEAGAAAERLFAASGLLARLAETGYAVGAVLGEDLLRERPALARGFVDATRPDEGRLSGAEVVARASAWVRKHRERPLFLWIHLAEPGGPFVAGPERLFRSPPGRRIDAQAIPEPMRVTDPAGHVLTDLAAYRDLYDEVLVGTDRVIGRFVNDLYRLDLYDRSLIAVAGLSGVDLGDGPQPLTPAGSLHETETAVLLVVKFPGNRYMGSAVDTTPVSVEQLAPTVEEFLRPGGRAPRSRGRVVEGDLPPPEITVRLPDGSAVERVFETFKVRWRGHDAPEVLSWEPGPPWETPLGDDLPAAVEQRVSEIAPPRW
ncbi:MAG: sulfatase-like hydrolase/transferase [Planctomycetes bacterium]|nr:sulfatase-like hydrolase/transferase [Planctomycetota bacterium]